MLLVDLNYKLNANFRFQNLGILFVGKKEVPDILFQRKMEELLSRTGSRNRLTGKMKKNRNYLCILVIRTQLIRFHVLPAQMTRRTACGKKQNEKLRK